MLWTGGVFEMERPPVPVTAKLSRKFYEAFGDEIANELVECSTRWMPRIAPIFVS